MYRHKQMLWLPVAALLAVGGMNYAVTGASAQNRDDWRNPVERTPKPEEQDKRGQAEQEYRDHLESMKQKIKKLGDKITDNGERTSQQWDQMKQAFQQQIEAISRQIDEMRYRAGQEWKQLSDQVDQSLRQLHQQYEQTADLFQE